MLQSIKNGYQMRKIRTFAAKLELFLCEQLVSVVWFVWVTCNGRRVVRLVTDPGFYQCLALSFLPAFLADILVKKT